MAEPLGALPFHGMSRVGLGERRSGMWSRWWYCEGPPAPLSRAICAQSHLPPTHNLRALVWGGALGGVASVPPYEELSTNMLPQPALVQASTPPLTVTLGKQFMLLDFPHL